MVGLVLCDVERVVVPLVLIVVLCDVVAVVVGVLVRVLVQVVLGLVVCVVVRLVVGVLVCVVVGDVVTVVVAVVVPLVVGVVLSHVLNVPSMYLAGQGHTPFKKYSLCSRHATTHQAVLGFGKMAVFPFPWVWKDGSIIPSLCIDMSVGLAVGEKAGTRHEIHAVLRAFKGHAVCIRRMLRIKLCFHRKVLQLFFSSDAFTRPWLLTKDTAQYFLLPCIHLSLAASKRCHSGCRESYAKDASCKKLRVGRIL